MTVISSPTLPQTPQLCKKACKACGLHIYQKPVFDRLHLSNIFWVGLSAVLFDKDDEKLPLSTLTASGILVHAIEEPYKKIFSFYKTNLVKCAPLQEDKIRYPSVYEMEKCFSNFLWELETLRPTTVFLLGRQVTDFVSRKLGLAVTKINDSFGYEKVSYGGIQFISVHHPSYILVYKRKFLQQYTDSIQSIIRSTTSPSKAKKKSLCLQTN